MKTAFSVWEHRIAPVFDTAHQILIVESDGSRVSTESIHVIPEESIAQRVAWLASNNIDTLVCGAISRPLQMELVAAGLVVIPFIAGDLPRVIQASFDGTLSDITFRMPGCCGGQGVRRRDGSGRGVGGGRGQGRGEGNNRHCGEGNGRRCGGRNRF